MQPENAVPASVASQTPAERGGCLTTLLVVIVVGNCLVAIWNLVIYATLAQFLPYMPDTPDLPRGQLYLLGVVCMANVVSAVLIWNWRRIGFWGIIAAAIVSLAINLSNHLGAEAFVSLLAPAILALLVRPRWTHFK